MGDRVDVGLVYILDLLRRDPSVIHTFSSRLVIQFDGIQIFILLSSLYRYLHGMTIEISRIHSTSSLFDLTSSIHISLCIFYFSFCLRKLGGVEHRSDEGLQVVHHKHRAAHATVTERGTTIEAGEATLRHDRLGSFRERTVLDPLDVALHACFDGIGRMGKVAGEQSTQKGGRDTCLVVGIELFRKLLSKVAPDDGGDAQISTSPQSLANGGTGKAPHGRGGVGHRPRRSEEAGALALLLDHDQLEGRAGQR